MYYEVNVIPSLAKSMKLVTLILAQQEKELHLLKN